MGGVDLRVPPVVPVIVEAALRTAVDEERQRVGLVGIEVDRIDDVAKDLVVVRAMEGELLVRAKCDAGEAFVVEVGDLQLHAPARGHHEELDRRHQAVTRKEQPSVRERLWIRVGVNGGDRRHHAVRGIDSED